VQSILLQNLEVLGRLGRRFQWAQLRKDIYFVFEVGDIYGFNSFEKNQRPLSSSLMLWLIATS
jgi:hypothetical protein